MDPLLRYQLDVGHESDRLGISIPDGEWYAPDSVALDRGFLSDTAGSRLKPRRATLGLLDKVIALRAAGDEEIRVFAEQHGALCPWRQVRKSYIYPVPVQPHQLHARSLTQAIRPPSRSGAETCDEWRGFASTLGFFAHLHAQLSAEKTAEAWRFFCSESPDAFKIYLESPTIAPGTMPIEVELVLTAPGSFAWTYGHVESGRGIAQLAQRLAARYLDGALLLGGAQLRVDDALGIRPEIRNLVGAVSLQLLHLLRGSRSISICDGCGTAYSPRRKPRHDRRNFCDQCRKEGVSGRQASRRYDQKQSNRHALDQPRPSDQRSA